MPMPTDIKIIDCMLGIPETEDRGDWFESFRPLIKDAQTLEQFTMPAQYMFKDIPDTGNPADLNGDGVVDGADLGILLGAWGSAGPGDLDGNGVVDGADLGILLGAWS